MVNKVIFDIGANDGSSCYNYTQDPLTFVYAFEPTPELLQKYLYAKQKDNYIVIPFAVSDFDGTSTFNIAGQSDWGCSSIYDFEENLDKTWPGRTDFKVTKKIKVNVTRMDTFIDSNNIKKIDYMHCDTQGNDLNVLKSFGKYISILEAGVVEATNRNPLYKLTNNSLYCVLDFLEKNNFTITRIHSNDIYDNEVNIFFKKK